MVLQTGQNTEEGAENLDENVSDGESNDPVSGFPIDQSIPKNSSLSQ